MRRFRVLPERVSKSVQRFWVKTRVKAASDFETNLPNLNGLLPNERLFQSPGQLTGTRTPDKTLTPNFNNLLVSNPLEAR
jgi:hypothetical protein